MCFMSIDGPTSTRMCFLSLSAIFVQVTVSLTRALLLFLSAGSAENITISETFMPWWATSTAVRRCTMFQSHWWVPAKVVSKSSPPRGKLSASPELSLAEAHRSAPVGEFLWLRRTDLHYLSVRLHSSHPGNLMECSKFRLLWKFHLHIHSFLLSSSTDCKNGKCAVITLRFLPHPTLKKGSHWCNPVDTLLFLDFNELNELI